MHLNNIKENVSKVLEDISRAAEESGRSSADVTLMAVTKTRSPQEVDEIIRCGIGILGENRIQEARDKIPQVEGKADWQLIGHLQTNKARQAVDLFRTIQSIDSIRVAEAVNRAVERKNSEGSDPDRKINVLVEVNTSGEESKFGIDPDQAQELIGKVSEMKYIKLQGLMTIGALDPDESRVRAGFSLLRRIRESAETALGPASLPVLSMGMSGDYRWAIAEGSTLVRVGTALFGPRT